MIKPVRLQLSRKKGFNLQRTSLALNGLAAVNVARPSMWGNRWVIGTHSNFLGKKVETVEESVAVYRELAWPEGHHRHWVRENLAGKNLCCWCGLDQICHADVLLEFAASTPARPALDPRREG